jgi:hypothetical protein
MLGFLVPSHLHPDHIIDRDRERDRDRGTFGDIWGVREGLHSVRVSEERKEGMEESEYQFSPLSDPKQVATMIENATGIVIAVC